MIRARTQICGTVQGVGFRPFIYKLCTALNLAGWVSNTPQGVMLEAEGGEEKVREFLHRLEDEKPPNCFIYSIETTLLDPIGHIGFSIRDSEASGVISALVLPDIATCSECLAEIRDPRNRRFRYPFTNCTHCGPRFSIIERLPYDRRHTTMRRFTMCPECSAEYHDPNDRRFHAQPNACPQCGPQLTFINAQGRVESVGDAALMKAGQAIRDSQILAIKGLGGFQLMVDARNDAAVRRLRDRKHREEKPFALMFPNMASVMEVCAVTDEESRLLTSPQSPIVLLKRRETPTCIAKSVAPGNPYLGIMLPYTPLHHLLLADLAFPVVATSGNLCDEPICVDEADAQVRLHGIADAYLVHDRPIVRQVDDSIVRIAMGREMMLRRARGYAPLPVMVKKTLVPVLAVGAHLKNSITVGKEHHLFVSQHIGDLETEEAFKAFVRVAADMQQLFAVSPEVVACDLHPDYLSTQHARKLPTPVVQFQHHAAHVAACMAENDLEGAVLGVAWDGTGLGTNNTIWGGEFIRMQEGEWKRAAWLRPFRLPGGDSAARQPCRSALGLLFELFGVELFSRKDLAPVNAFPSAERTILSRMFQRGINVPYTSSMGRLFDAVASIVGLRQHTHFEGQSAMALEWLVQEGDDSPGYHFDLCPAGKDQAGWIADWEPLVRELQIDVERHLPLEQISAKFHQGLAELIVAVARRVGEELVVLSGGCFQNRVLLERSVEQLTRAGFKPYWHQRIPPNDGGISLGQAVMAAYRRTGTDYVFGSTG